MRPLGDQYTQRRRRLGCVTGLISSTLTGPRHIVQWTSKFTRKSVKSSLAGEVRASSEIVDRVPTLRELFARSMHLFPGMAALEDYEFPPTRLKKKKIIAGRFPVVHCLATYQASETRESGNIYWLPGLGNPAGGLAKTKSDAADRLHFRISDTYNRVALRPLRGVAYRGD